MVASEEVAVILERNDDRPVRQGYQELLRIEPA